MLRYAWLLSEGAWAKKLCLCPFRASTPEGSHPSGKPWEITDKGHYPVRQVSSKMENCGGNCGPPPRRAGTHEGKHERWKLRATARRVVAHRKRHGLRENRTRLAGKPMNSSVRTCLLGGARGQSLGIAAYSPGGDGGWVIAGCGGVRRGGVCWS